MNRTAVVTGTPRIGPNDGGSDGDDHAGIGSAIGGAIAHRLVKDGFRIVGVARNVQVTPLP